MTATHAALPFGEVREVAALRGAAHLLTMAATRSGEGVGAIIPDLLMLDRSAIRIDPKDENARVTARARRQRQGLVP